MRPRPRAGFKNDDVPSRRASFFYIQVDIDLIFASVPWQTSRAPDNIQIRQNKARGSTYVVSLPTALTPLTFFLGGWSDGGLELVGLWVSPGLGFGTWSWVLVSWAILRAVELT